MPRSTTPLTRTRARAGLGMAAVAVLALTACGPKDEGWPAPLPSSAAPSTALPSMDLTPFTLDVPSLDLALVPGATVAVDEGQRPTHHGAWLEVRDAPVWTEAMAGRVKEQIAAYRRDTDVAADPRLDVQTQLAVVGEKVAAARLLTTQTRGSESVSSVETVWYSPADARVLAPADLFTAEGWDAFRAEVRDRMAGDPDIVQDRLTSAVDTPDLAENRRVWDAVVLLPDGSALLEVDQAALAPAAAGVLATRIPAATVQPWLSELGRAAQEAARAPKALDLTPTRPTSAPPASSSPPAAATTAGPQDPTRPAPGTTSPPTTPVPAPGQTSAPDPVPAAPAPADPAPADPGTTDPGPVAPAPVPVPDPATPAPTRAPLPTAVPTPAPTTSAPTPRPTPPSSAPTTAPTPRPTSPAPTTPAPTGPVPTTAPPEPTAPPTTTPAPSAPTGTASTTAAAQTRLAPGRPSAPGDGVTLPPQASQAPGQAGR